MKIRLPRTLFWRLGLVLMLVQVVVAGGLAWYALNRVRDLHHQQAFEQLSRLLPVLVDRYADAAAVGDYARLDAMAKQDGVYSALRVTVILPNGTVAADSHGDPGVMENHRYRPEVLAALREEMGSELRYSTTTQQSMLYVARRLDRNGEAMAIVRTAIPLTEVNEDFLRIARVIGLAGLMSILLTFAAILLISRHYSSQVVRLAQAARGFAGGDLDRRIERPPYRELSALAESLNTMARQLQERIDQLRTQEAELRGILQSMSSGVIALDSRQRILNINRSAQRLFQFEQDPHGRLLQEMIREPALHRLTAAVLKGQKPAPVELPLRTSPDITVRASAELLRHGEGGSKGALLLVDDVTQLRRLERMRSDFASNVSHELRTPITNIKGYVETLLETGEALPSQTRHFLKIIRKNSDRLASIVDDVLSLTQLEQPRFAEHVERTPMPASELIESAVSQFRPAAGAKRMRLVVEVEAGLELNVHGPLFEQAISNLISNAINYSPEETTVTIAARHRDGETEIEVRDEGPGIAAEHHSRLFERFYRVDRGRSRAVGGTGLGLAIVKHILLAHGGRVAVESEPGRGSAFRLIVPE